MIFQEPMLALDPVYTIGDQIAETVVRHTGVSWAGRPPARARNAGERCASPPRKRRLEAYPHEMSGGMRQRAMIALALSCGPKVLLADEPTTALDATVQIQILLLLRELQREMGMAVIFVTHDIGVAVEISDRIAVMYGGRIVETGPLRDVVRDAAAPLYARASLLDRARRRAAASGSKRSRARRRGSTGCREGCAFAPRCGLADAACSHGEIAAVTLGRATARALPEGERRRPSLPFSPTPRRPDDRSSWCASDPRRPAGPSRSPRGRRIPD